MLASGCLAAGCGRQAPAATPASPAGAAGQAVAPASPSTGQHGRGRSGRAPAAGAARLPLDWPSNIPIPAGRLQSSAGSAGQWTALILAIGSARDVLRSAATFYLAEGFTAVNDSMLRRPPFAITIGVENRDHSPTETYLVVAVTRTR